jgi:hypothetical protein
MLATTKRLWAVFLVYERNSCCLAVAALPHNDSQSGQFASKKSAAKVMPIGIEAQGKSRLLMRKAFD